MGQKKCEYSRRQYEACSLGGALVRLAVASGMSVAQGGVDAKGNVLTLCDEGGDINCWARQKVEQILAEAKAKDPSFDSDEWRNQMRATD